jgi:hypothetical protein
VVSHSQQLRAQAAFPDGSTADVTSDAAWRCEDETTCTVSAAGVLTGVTGGQTNVTAKWKALSASVPVTAGYILTAIVHEAAPTASRNLADVAVQVVGGALQGQTSSTDADGRVTLPLVERPGFDVYFKKPGYDDVRYSVVQLPRDSAANISLAPAAVTIPFSLSGQNPCTELQPWGGEYPFTGGNARLVTSFPVYRAGQIVVTELQVPYDIGGTALLIVRLDPTGRVVGSDSIESFPFPPLPPPGPVQRPLVPGYNYVLLFAGDVGPVCAWPYRIVFTYQR